MSEEPQSHRSDVVPAPEASGAAAQSTPLEPVVGVEPVVGSASGAGPSADASPSAGPSLSGGSAPPVMLQQSARPMTPIPVLLRSWPVVDSLGEFLFLAALVLGTPILAFNFLGPISSAIAATALVCVSWRHFVPTQFELSALGVNIIRLGRNRRIPWMSIDRYLVGKQGVYLSSAGAPLEVFRGIYVPWGKSRDLVLMTLRYYLPRAEEAIE